MSSAVWKKEELRWRMGIILSWEGSWESKVKFVSWAHPPSKAIAFSSPFEAWKSQSENSVVSDSLWPHGLYRSWNSLGQNTGVGSLIPSPVDLHNPGIKQGSSALPVDSLPAEPPGKPWFRELAKKCSLPLSVCVAFLKVHLFSVTQFPLMLKEGIMQYHLL